MIKHTKKLEEEKEAEQTPLQILVSFLEDNGDLEEYLDELEEYGQFVKAEQIKKALSALVVLSNN